MGRNKALLSISLGSSCCTLACCSLILGHWAVPGREDLEMLLQSTGGCTACPNTKSLPGTFIPKCQILFWLFFFFFHSFFFLNHGMGALTLSRGSWAGWGSGVASCTSAHQLVCGVSALLSLSFGNSIRKKEKEDKGSMSECLPERYQVRKGNFLMSPLCRGKSPFPAAFEAGRRIHEWALGHSFWPCTC